MEEYEELKDNEILVAYMNASFVQVGASDSVIRELNDFFTIDVPGAKFTPAYKNKKWDGKKRIFNIMTQTLPVGLLSMLKTEFASPRNYVVKEYDQMDLGQKISPDTLATFLNDLSVCAHGEKIEYHPHQKEAVFHCINNPRTTVSSPTSSGKSLIIYSLIRWYLKDTPKNILLIVPTVSLVLQMYSDFEDYSGTNGWSVEDNCHKIYAGQEKDSKKPVTISTWQSMQHKPAGYFQKFDVVICDEVHLAAAAVISKVVESSSNAYVRFGFTGTLQDAKCHRLVILGHFGPEKRVIETKELMDQGYISNLLIKCVLFKYKPEDIKELERLVNTGKKANKNGYAIESEYIVNHSGRMNNLVALIISLKGNTLVLFNLIKHGKDIFKRLNELNDRHNLNKTILFISGETPADIREEMRDIMEKNEDVIAIASYGTTSTGVSVRNIKNVVFGSPRKSKITVLQSIGRGLRKNEGKEYVTLYDIVDDLSRKTKKGNTKLNYSTKHFAERFSIYQRERFNFKTMVKNL